MRSKSRTARETVPHQLTHQFPSRSTLAADCYKTVASCLAEMKASVSQRCLEVVSRRDTGLCLAEMKASARPLQASRCLTETQVFRRYAGRQRTRMRMRRPVPCRCKGKER